MLRKALLALLTIALVTACSPTVITGGGGAPVTGPVVPVGSPEIRELSPTTETVWNCGSGGGTVIKHPTMTVLTSHAVEWQTGGRTGVGVRIGDGVIPGGVDLSATLENYVETGFEQGVQQGTGWDLPAEPNTIIVYTLTWREIWQPGTINVILSDQSAVQVDVRYRTGIQSEIVGKDVQSCDGEQQPANPAEPTVPVVIPTNPPIPTPTAIANTSAGSILGIRQSWWQDGLELTLVDAYFDYTASGAGCWDCGDPGAYLTFRLTNHKAQQITVQYNLKYDLVAVDNLGRDLFVGVTSNAYLDSFDDQTVLVGSGESIFLAGWGGYGEPGMIVLVDTADLAVTEFIVSLSISSIREARWRIEVAH